MGSSAQSSTIITCDFRYLIQRCAQRKYAMHEVMPCVLKKDGHIWTIDTAHPAYPRTPKEIMPLVYVSSTNCAPQNNCRAGEELKRLLKKWLNITATENCSCNSRAKTMDQLGCDWCENNINTIVGWLREEAQKRRLPFIDAAGKILVKRAISNARRAENERKPN